jgi:hypothetical protein
MHTLCSRRNALDSMCMCFLNLFHVHRCWCVHATTCYHLTNACMVTLCIRVMIYASRYASIRFIDAVSVSSFFFLLLSNAFMLCVMSTMLSGMPRSRGHVRLVRSIITHACFASVRVLVISHHACSISSNFQFACIVAPSVTKLDFR